ncbi:MAG: hypothetical protein JW740_01465 [Candidatus Zambryskibacteria bacterium]|nr:hypothetical protein [Candidatus Zambryskibacteria bacterium]
MKKLIFIIFLIPNTIFAASAVDLLDSALNIVTKILIPIAFALCLLYFFWGVVKYINKGAINEEAAKEGKRVMIWGVVGIFIAFSIWGIVKFIQTELVIPDIEKIERPVTGNK